MKNTENANNEPKYKGADTDKGCIVHMCKVLVSDTTNILNKTIAQAEVKTGVLNLCITATFIK
jgi:hypothetical protein